MVRIQTDLCLLDDVLVMRMQTDPVVCWMMC